MSENIRHFATSQGPYVAAALFENTVSIWNVEIGVRRSKFETILSFGGKRLAIDNDAEHCVAAAYHIHGIACYNSQNGSECWRRKDLKKVQVLKTSLDGERVFCFFDDRPCLVLDVNTGQEIRRLVGVRDVYQSCFEQVQFLDKFRPELQTTEGELIGRIDRLKFALLDAAFGNSSFCTSESGGDVRCFNTEKAKEIWRYAPSPGHHVLTLGYSERCDAYFGVEWPYVYGGNKLLKRFTRETGQVSLVCELGQPAETLFCLSGNYMLTSDGLLIDVDTGQTVRTLPFP